MTIVNRKWNILEITQKLEIHDTFCIHIVQSMKHVINMLWIYILETTQKLEVVLKTLKDRMIMVW